MKDKIRKLVYSGFENAKLGFVLMESLGLSPSDFPDFMELEELTCIEIGELVNMCEIGLGAGNIYELPETFFEK